MSKKNKGNEGKNTQGNNESDKKNDSLNDKNNTTVNNEDSEIKNVSKKIIDEARLISHGKKCHVRDLTNLVLKHDGLMELNK